MPETRHFLAYQEFSNTIFFKISLDISLNYFFLLFVAVNEENSKQSQISKGLINFQGNTLIFKERFSFSRSFKCP